MAHSGPRHKLPRRLPLGSPATVVAALVAILAILASACTSAVAQTDAMLLAPGQAEAATSGDEAQSSGTRGEPERAELPNEPELPPAAADSGAPIADNVATAEALGLIDVCSFYEDPNRLSELLGEFWSLGEGVPAEGKCLWVSSKTSDSSAVVSLELQPTDGPDDAGTPVTSDSGEGLRITVQGNEFRVNVVTNELDPTLAVLNVREAEARIADDIYLRLTGEERPR